MLTIHIICNKISTSPSNWDKVYFKKANTFSLVGKEFLTLLAQTIQKTKHVDYKKQISTDIERSFHEISIKM